MHGSVFMPIILGSDKTTVSVATGQNNFYPLYMSIGNIHNMLCRAHFPQGRHFKQWTGNDSKVLMKVSR